MNKIQFLTNLLNVLLIILLRSFVNIKRITDNLTFITLVCNCVALGVFIYLFFHRREREIRVSSLLLDSRSKKEIFDKLCKRVSINEGKFVFYWISGASLEYEPNQSDSYLKIDVSGKSQRFDEVREKL